jgi:hypothetical protein
MLSYASLSALVLLVRRSSDLVNGDGGATSSTATRHLTATQHLTADVLAGQAGKAAL